MNKNGYSGNFPNLVKHFAELLSYCLCKVIRQICERIIRRRGNGQLVTVLQPFNEQEVMAEGNRIIEKYCKRARVFAQKREKYLKRAFRLFKQEYEKYKYSEIFRENPKKQSEEEVFHEYQNFNQLWKNMRNYRSMWLDRVFAEKQVKSLLASQVLSQPISVSEIKFVNSYAAYLYKIIPHRNESNSAFDYAEAFRIWMFNSQD